MKCQSMVYWRALPAVMETSPVRYLHGLTTQLIRTDKNRNVRISKLAFDTFACVRKSMQQDRLFIVEVSLQCPRKV